MTDEEKMKEQIKSQFNIFGIDRMLSGLGEFLNRVEELQEKGEALERSGKFGGKGMKGEYTYTVRTLKDDSPRRVGIGIRPGAKNQGTYPQTDRGQRTTPRTKPKPIEPDEKPQEPLVDVFDKPDHIMVVVSIPNIKEDDLKFEIKNNILKITAETPEGNVVKDISIPKGSKVDKITNVSFKNGILEIKLSKKPTKKSKATKGKDKGSKKKKKR